MGKEKYLESGLYYYGARYYAAWTCRFISIDPLAADYPFYTPYNYAGNKPINKIDIDGMQEEGAPTAPTGETNNKNNVSPAQSVDNIDRSEMYFGSAGLRRRQVGGNVTVNLPPDFEYIQPFDSTQRASLDEASSLLYFNFSFKDRMQLFDFTAGAFRNHTKGDFIFPDAHNVHWSIGNSQVGFSLGFRTDLPIYKGFRISLSAFYGFGPQISKFTSNNVNEQPGNPVSPECWKTRGYGHIGVATAEINSGHLHIKKALLDHRKFLNFFKRTANGAISTLNSATVGAEGIAVYHNSSYYDFTVQDYFSGEVNSYSGLNFSTIAYQFTMNITFHLNRSKKP